MGLDLKWALGNQNATKSNIVLIFTWLLCIKYLKSITYVMVLEYKIEIGIWCSSL